MSDEQDYNGFTLSELAQGVFARLWECDGLADLEYYDQVSRLDRVTAALNFLFQNAEDGAPKLPPKALEELCNSVMEKQQMLADAEAKQAQRYYAMRKFNEDQQTIGPQQ